jgi:divalent metal cation (Fe/Co/Zn/Cd) transporter
LIIAAIATALSTSFDAPWLHGTGSILIGIVFPIVTLLLARESKDLQIGEGASARLSSSIRETALHQRGVRNGESILTIQLSPDQVIATLSVEFDDELKVPQVERLIGGVEHELRKKHPELFRIFMRPTPRLEQLRGSAALDAQASAAREDQSSERSRESAQ